MSLETITVCPLCQGNSFQPFLVCKDFTTSGELFHVKQCIVCNLVFTNPRPTETDAAMYYKSDSYISHTSAASGFLDYIYLIIRHFTLGWKYRIIKSYLKSDLLLDVGCGTGQFINYCASHNVNAHGVEPSAEAREAAKTDLVVESMDKLPNIKFDVITLWHVLEHIYDLPTTISQLKNKLTENGTIFIAVPNYESFDANHYKELWAAYDVPRHVWHFSKKTMEMLVEKHGFHIKRIIPMKLDSYYVSLLSEKNSSKGKLTLSNTFTALRIGLRSNLKAKSELNHSSLIYQIQK
ncbi:class I SAM-dependent methyltransferase [soil metagenome]